MSPKTKRTPMRMCVGCREMKPKKELIRIVTPRDGETQLDPTGKANGRGAYVCKDTACMERAAKNKSLRLPERIIQDLQDYLAEEHGEK